MLASHMPPQTSLQYSCPSSTADDKDRSSSQSTMTSTISPASTQHTPTVSPPTMATTVPSRPKLTLQTSSLPLAFGTSSTGLSFSRAGGPTASPTVRNTFKNAYEVTAPPSVITSPSSKSSINRISKPSSPYTSSNPYQQPLGVKSILRNSPLEPTSRRRSVSAASLQGSRRVFFPAKKQVSYRQPLEEEIHTVRYTARHSDLTDSDHTPHEASFSGDSDSSSSRQKRKHFNTEKQVRAVALMDGLDSDTPPTPRQARSKRRCEWRWTLGPLEKRADTVAVTSPRSTHQQNILDKEPASPTSLNSSDVSTDDHSCSPSSVISETSNKAEELENDTSHEIQYVHADQVQ
ncbi:hypothetical protein FE257_004144 [Aspergillus nanangensis]|uniref:Uncharacterized protein n=1 Tax=Aspergillus nanangensis TaxID=2582783 RepID=A0AAD4CAV3_ASPNN|nr:hypothetical protein FE257_004144 [Aspergillus nanangensis]